MFINISMVISLLMVLTLHFVDLRSLIRKNEFAWTKSRLFCERSLALEGGTCEELFDIDQKIRSLTICMFHEYKNT